MIYCGIGPSLVFFHGHTALNYFFFWNLGLCAGVFRGGGGGEFILFSHYSIFSLYFTVVGFLP